MVHKMPHLQIYFAHLASGSLPADLNSKKVSAPLDISSSELWKSGPEEYFNLEPPENWFLRVTATNLDWRVPIADKKVSAKLPQSHFCCCEGSEDFCGTQNERVMYCNFCQGDSLECINIQSHYESFTSMVLATTPDVSQNPIIPLDLKTYNNLLARSTQLIKILRVMSLHCFMTQILAHIDPDFNASAISLSKTAVLCQPKNLERIRKYKPSQADLTYAFHLLIRTSQSHNKPSSKYFLPTELPNGLIVTSLRYEESAAEAILGCKFLPLISSQDKKMVRLLFYNAHIISAGPFSLHINKSATIARLRTGPYGTVLAHARKILTPLISECVRCVRVSKAPLQFNPQLGAPRFLGLLDSTSPIFIGVSFDLIGPLRFLQKRGARGATATSKGYALIGVCCLTKFVCYYLLEDAKKVDIELAVAEHVAKFRAPRFILTDAGTSNDILEDSQTTIVEALQKSVKMEILQSSHQFLNLVESTIRIFKNILRSTFSGIPPTAPTNTRAEYHCIFSHICNILNSRPISNNSQDMLTLNANQIVKPFISAADQELLVQKYLEEIFYDSDRHTILLKVFQNNESMARTATEILKREFLENAKLFTDKKDSLKPLVGDLVLICKETPGLGLITKILSPRRVMVRHKHRGSNIEDEYHSKILALIFRPQTPIHFLQISNEEMPHMLQNFWEKLKEQLTWHALPTQTAS